MSSLKNGLTNKGYSKKILAGLNGRLNAIEDIKTQYNIEMLNSLIENTNYPLLVSVVHGLGNVCDIIQSKSDWFLYPINQDEDIQIMQESFISKDTLIYIAEKSILGKISCVYVVFSKIK